MVSSAGGRVQLGFEGSHTSGEMASDMEKFFQRLNGSVNNGEKRTAGKAYNDPGANYHTYFKMFGNDWTTLNPSPLLTAKTGIHENKATALIVFDTFMYSGIAADNAVVFTTGTGSARRWFGFTDHKYGISFDFSATPTANTKAKAILCVNEEFSGGRKLSGDKKTYGSDKS